MPLIWNPGEPVIDQETGEPFIDEEGNLVEVAPLKQVPTVDGRTLDGDDISNASFYRANKHEGETLRDRFIGVPYLRLALGQGDLQGAVNLITAEIQARTPGVAGIADARVMSFDPKTRVLIFRCVVIRTSGDESIQDFAVG